MVNVKMFGALCFPKYSSSADVNIQSTYYAFIKAFVGQSLLEKKTLSMSHASALECHMVFIVFMVDGTK